MTYICHVRHTAHLYPCICFQTFEITKEIVNIVYNTVTFCLQNWILNDGTGLDERRRQLRMYNRTNNTTHK